MNNEQDIDPVDLQNTLIGFLGQTYREISTYDSNIVSPNAFLSPKKQEFQRTAEQVMHEIRPNGHTSIQRNMPMAPQQQYLTQQPQHSVPAVVIDKDQMEFDFSNSVTAITINNKLEDIEKRLKRLDNTLSKVLSLLDSNDTEDSQ
jgi:hypothetical protein